ncbi:MAG: MTH1187 family thiamine-binding protein [Candidatus Altiarchaeota archaeon]|nr:MTH1187 family thiamine-binding protein [Candidatus Altiarchaeota archaeon]
MAKEKKIVAELSVVPLGVGPSVSKYVKEAIRQLKSGNVRVELGAMGTVLEADDMDDLLEAVKMAHEAVFRAGAVRVVTTLKIDERRDKNLSIESKLKAIKT